MKETKKITIDWQDTESLSFEAKEQLEKDGFDRALEMMQEGYTSGELCSSIDEIQFYGWWSIDKVKNEYLQEIKASSKNKEHILKLANNDILNQYGVLNFDWLFDGKKWFFNVDDIDSFVVTYLNENTFRLRDCFFNFVMDFEATNKDDLLLQIFNFFNHKNILIEDATQE